MLFAGDVCVVLPLHDRKEMSWQQHLPNAVLSVETCRMLGFCVEFIHLLLRVAWHIGLLSALVSFVAMWIRLIPALFMINGLGTLIGFVSLNFFRAMLLISWSRFLKLFSTRDSICLWLTSLVTCLGVLRSSLDLVTLACIGINHQHKLTVWWSWLKSVVGRFAALSYLALRMKVQRKVLFNSFSVELFTVLF